MQFKILKPLIEETLADSSEFKTFFYVGDTKQSIYRFRGGKRELFDFVLKNYPQIELDELNNNFRSCKEVVEFVNNSFDKLGSYEYLRQNPVKDKGFVKVLEDDSLMEENKFDGVVKEVSNLLQEGVNPNSIAVLTYTNDNVLELSSYLSKKFTGLKITTEMSSKLINQENVKACINAIKYLYFQEKLYLENLNALIGKPPKTKLEFSFDLKTLSVKELIYNISNHFDFMDENIIKLILEASAFDDIVDFIYEIDKLEATIDSKEQQGLQILTIFKSKGLEFDTVILLDRIKSKNSDKSSLLFDYENVTLQNVFYKVSKLENFDENYANALKKEKALQHEDELNILYVALTRAKSNLIIFKKSEKSVFDILNLKSSSFGQLVINKEEEQKNEEEKIYYKPLNLPRQNSKAMTKDDEEYKDYSLKSRYFGIATHYCLEMMDEFTKTSLVEAMLLIKSKYHSFLEELDFENIYKRVLKLVQNEVFIDFIQGAKLYKEQALLFNDELKIVDLLIKKDDKYFIFDYKTTINEKDEHIIQVKQYEKAIKEIVKSDEVYSFLIYLNEDKTIFKEVK